MLGWTEAERRFPGCSVQWEIQHAGDPPSGELTIIGGTLWYVKVANGVIAGYYARWDPARTCWVAGHLLVRHAVDSGRLP